MRQECRNVGCLQDRHCQQLEQRLVFVDAAGTAGVVDAGDEILQRFDAAPAGVTVLSNDRPSVRFAGSGLPSSAVDTAFTIKHVECVGNNQRTVKISGTGRLHTNKGACS